MAKEKNKEYQKKYYESHKEEKKEYYKKYYEAHRDLIIKFNKYRRYFRKKLF